MRPEVQMSLHTVFPSPKILKYWKEASHQTPLKYAIKTIYSVLCTCILCDMETEAGISQSTVNAESAETSSKKSYVTLNICTRWAKN